MKVLAEKRKELSQTVAFLIGSLRTEKGCLRCDFYRSMEDENELCILEKWNTRKNLKSFTLLLKPSLTKRLRGLFRSAVKSQQGFRMLARHE